MTSAGSHRQGRAGRGSLGAALSALFRAGNVTMVLLGEVVLVMSSSLPNAAPVFVASGGVLLDGMGELLL